MNGTLLNIILWIPFGLVLLIAAIVFMITGYKQGFWRALLSVVATAVSAVLSLLLVKLIAPLCADSVVRNFSIGGMQGIPLSQNLILDLVKGAVSVVLAIILFSTILFLLTIIIKSFFHNVAAGKMLGQKKWQKWAGMGVRLVDAVIYSLLLALPLYGTLATYAPTAQALVNLQSEDTDETAAYLETVVSHPVVLASKTGPVSWVYEELSAVEIGDSRIDVASIASSAEGMISRADALSKASKEERLPLANDLIDYVRENVIEQDWCYDLAKQLLDQMEQAVRSSVSAQDQTLVNELFAICDVTREEFLENADELLGFAQYILENQLMEKNLKMLAGNEAFLGELGKLINSTEQAVALKNLLIMTAVKQELFGGNAAEANQFIQEHLSTAPTAASQRTQEAKAFIAIFSASNPYEMAQALALHPAIDEADVLKWLSISQFGF